MAVQGRQRAASTLVRRAERVPGEDRGQAGAERGVAPLVTPPPPHPSPSPGQWVSCTVLPVARSGQRGESKAQSTLRRLRTEGQVGTGTPARRAPSRPRTMRTQWRLLPPSGNHHHLWVHGGPSHLTQAAFPRIQPDTRPEPHSPAAPTSLGGRRTGMGEAGLPGRASSWQGVLGCL